MLIYNIDPKVEAFSTNIKDSTDFDVTLPLHQAHGTGSVIVDANGPQEDTYGADALITNICGVRIGVKTADCVPILLYEPEAHIIAAIHSGWKGTVANITGITIERMKREFDSLSEKMKAVIGPCIHVEAFEVGNEVYNAFVDAGYGNFCHRMPAFGTEKDVKWHIDLPGICRQQLMEAGVKNIETRSECTYNMYHDFYSARRLGKNFGKQRILTCIRLIVS